VKRLAEPSLEGVHAKVRRAEAHFETLYSGCRAFIERDQPPFGISIPYYDAETGYYVCKAIVSEPVPVRLGVILGDVIHNARSALDHLVWQLVIANNMTPRGGPRGNAWPIAMTSTEWKATGKARLNGVRATQRDLIDQGQPYKAGRSARNTFPAMLADLSNTDKHQIVHATGALIIDPGEEVKFTVKSGPGDIVRSEVRHGGRFEHGADLLRTRVTGRTHETEVWMEGNGPVEMAFGERSITISQVRGIIEWVKVAIRDLEASLDG
jgi:hypothetical protein